MFFSGDVVIFYKFSSLNRTNLYLYCLHHVSLYELEKVEIYPLSSSIKQQQMVLFNFFIIFVGFNCCDRHF